ncbi:MAG TPA: hypothetical protein VEX68_13355 [Bryobacteraceae bacterium]|nr:hypothetical protein [Bryobacteraceae bacterium]
MPAVNSEVRIERKYTGGGVQFGQPNQAYVGQGYRSITVASHERFEVGVLLVMNRDAHNTRLKNAKIESTSCPFEQECRLSQNRFAGEQGRSQLLP